MRSAFVLLLFASSLAAQVPANLPPVSTFLKANSTIQQIATDAQGYIYVCGNVNPAAANQGSNQIFIGRLDPAATKFTYLTYLTASAATIAEAITVDAAGNAYIAGLTDASDFPAVPAPSGPIPFNAQLPFAAKINPSGAIVYATLFSNGASATPQAIAVDSNGEVIVSGVGAGNGTNFPVTQGAYKNLWTYDLPFTTKLDATGTHLVFSVLGVGGSSLALGNTGNVFIAGTWSFAPAQFGPQYPTTPGAFQQSYKPYTICISPSCMFAPTAGEQYVTKLSADGSALIYSTFVTGSKGAYNAGMAIDAAGDVWLTGATNSPDYPFTQGGSALISQTFTTELNPGGSQLMLSVPTGVPSGNGSNIAIDPQGNVVVTGLFPVTYSPSFLPNAYPLPPLPPGGNSPSQCLPGPTSNVSVAAYVMLLSSHDGSVIATQVFPGSLQNISSTVDAAGNVYFAGVAGLPDVPLTPSVLFDAEVAARTVPGAFLQRTNFSAPTAIACVTDSSNGTLIGPVAPGQLITLYGNAIGPAQPAVGIAGGLPTVPISLAGVTITFDNQPAPLLYVSSTQINVQVPFEVKPRAATVMQLSFNGSVLGTRLFAVAPENPSVFLASKVAGFTCGNEQAGPSLLALAINDDGTLNSCGNPAKAGSLVSLFVNGIGTSGGNLATGALNGLSAGFVFGTAEVSVGYYSAEVDSLNNLAGAISGVAQLNMRIPDTISTLTPESPISLTVTLNNLPAGPLAAGTSPGSTGTSIPLTIFAKP
jgi:uncharacterized protein (TIGR03437 family)